MLNEVETLRAACCLAGIDGQVGDRERAMLERMAHKIGAGTASLEAMIQMAQSEPDYYDDLFEAMRNDPEDTIRTLLQVAAADNDVSPDQRVIMGIFAKRLGMDSNRYDELVNATVKAVAKRVDEQQSDKVKKE